MIQGDHGRIRYRCCRAAIEFTERSSPASTCCWAMRARECLRPKAAIVAVDRVLLPAVLPHEQTDDQPDASAHRVGVTRSSSAVRLAVVQHNIEIEYFSISRRHFTLFSIKHTIDALAIIFFFVTSRYHVRWGTR